MTSKQEQANKIAALSPVVDDMINQLEERDWGSAEVKRYFIDKIMAFTDGATYAAVMAEREACAKVANDFPVDGLMENTTIDGDDLDAVIERDAMIAAAIRARNGAGK